MKKPKKHHLDEDISPIIRCKKCHEPFSFGKCNCKPKKQIIMAKSKVSFSLELLKSNLKWHKEMLGRYKKTEKKRSGFLNESFAKTIQKRVDKQSAFVKDLELSIKALKKIK